MSQRSTFRWYNRSLPSLLGGAVIFSYMQAVFILLSSRRVGSVFVGIAVLGFFLGAIGISNERRWGYSAALAVGLVWLEPQIEALVRYSALDIPQTAISAGLVAMLLWPESRDYQGAHFAP